VDLTDAPALPHVDPSLDPIRAAISLVADGQARRVTVHTPAAAQVMPAARQLARAAGVSIELVRDEDDTSEVVILPLAQEGA
jgi:hypothetical protein